ncbi:MAG TPA: hypothetical protein VHA12_00570 [Candidatus Nanoarchaeia archaeon]|nr:hypothetical protein [Candidatus Nanoarchaeia archaeon]
MLEALPSCSRKSWRLNYKSPSFFDFDAIKSALVSEKNLIYTIHHKDERNPVYIGAIGKEIFLIADNRLHVYGEEASLDLVAAQITQGISTVRIAQNLPEMKVSQITEPDKEFLGRLEKDYLTVIESISQTPSYSNIQSLKAIIEGSS